jgi:serine phosphatase RsbU (regulator of sigma subunit)
MNLFRADQPEASPSIEPVPTVFPEIDGADIAAVFVGKRVAGDFYDSIRVNSERILFGLLDVAGRRADTRGLLIAAQDIFRGLGAELFAGADINESDAMTELCLRMNRHLLEISHDVHPCPAFIACYHEEFGTLCYTNAGHTPGLLRDGSGISELASTGLPLGLFSHATCEAPTVGIEKGSALLLVSRGVVECGKHEDDCTEEFGLQRVRELFQQTTLSCSEDVCRSVLTAIDQFSANAPVNDDRTALTLLRSA